MANFPAPQESALPFTEALRQGHPQIHPDDFQLSTDCADFAENKKEETRSPSDLFCLCLYLRNLRNLWITSSLKGHKSCRMNSAMPRFVRLAALGVRFQALAEPEGAEAFAWEVRGGAPGA